MRIVFVTLIVWGICSPLLHAQTGKFPYAAVVDSDNLPVFCGPGRTRYYVTGRLERGDRVEVRRHDPGGWYVIAPPPGSFSAMPAEYVERISATKGRVKVNDVIVRVGSSVSAKLDVFQQRLSTGDLVEIIGEETIDKGGRTVNMYKISPPRGEYRYVQGRSVIPVDRLPVAGTDGRPIAGKGRQTGTTKRTSPTESLVSEQGNIFEDDSHLSTPNPRTDQRESGTVAERPLVRLSPGSATSQSGPTAAAFKAGKEKLTQVDDRFREMLLSEEPDQWDLQALQLAYQRLQRDDSLPILQSHLEMRLEAVERYQKIKTEYEEFVSLTAETSRRDSQLLAIQQDQQQRARSASQSAAPMAKPQPPVAGNQAPTTSPPLTAPRQVQTRRVPRFDGAGIVQRSALSYGGAPRHVLLAPNGRILAYLQGEAGLNLDQYLGRSMGIIGRRAYRGDLQADFIVVRNLVPVRLKFPGSR